MATQTQIVNRLKRARGQLDALIEQLESGDGKCREVLTQFAAVNSAMKRASYLAVATIMSQCAQEVVGSRDEADSPSTQPATFVATDRVTMEELEQLFLRLT